MNKGKKVANLDGGKVMDLCYFKDKITDAEHLFINHYTKKFVDFCKNAMSEIKDSSVFLKLFRASQMSYRMKSMDNSSVMDRNILPIMYNAFFEDENILPIADYLLSAYVFIRHSLLNTPIDSFVLNYGNKRILTKCAGFDYFYNTEKISKNSAVGLNRTDMFMFKIENSSEPIYFHSKDTTARTRIDDKIKRIIKNTSSKDSYSQLSYFDAESRLIYQWNIELIILFNCCSSYSQLSPHQKMRTYESYFNAHEELLECINREKYSQIDVLYMKYRLESLFNYHHLLHLSYKMDNINKDDLICEKLKNSLISTLSLPNIITRSIMTNNLIYTCKQAVDKTFRDTFYEFLTRESHQDYVFSELQRFCHVYSTYSYPLRFTFFFLLLWYSTSEKGISNDDSDDVWLQSIFNLYDFLSQTIPKIKDINHDEGSIDGSPDSNKQRSNIGKKKTNDKRSNTSLREIKERTPSLMKLPDLLSISSYNEICDQLRVSLAVDNIVK